MAAPSGYGPKIIPPMMPAKNPTVVVTENLNLPHTDGSTEITIAYQNRLLFLFHFIQVINLFCR